MMNSARLKPKNLCILFFLVACAKDVARHAERPDTGSLPRSASPTAGPDLGGEHYVGTRHDPLPGGVRSEGGALIRIGSADYSISHVRARGVDMLWLDSLVPGAKRAPEKIVRAELRIPPLARDERLLMASCDVNNRLDSRIVAIVVNEPGATKFTRVRQAWRADARRGRFDVIPVTGITCEDTGGE